MKINLNYSETDNIQNIIEEVYLNSNGKRGNVKPLVLDKDDIHYTLLRKSPFTHVKVKNEMIDGILEFEKKEYEDRIELTPNASYCIPVEDKYSFY